MQPISFPSNLPANVNICLEVANGNMLLNSLDLIVSKSIECHKQPPYVMQCNAMQLMVLLFVVESNSCMEITTVSTTADIKCCHS